MKSTRLLDNFEQELQFDIDTFLAKWDKRRRSTLRSTMTLGTTISLRIMPINRIKNGYDLKFDYSDGDNSYRERKIGNALKKILQAPDHISLTAVEYSLERKALVTNSMSWQGEQYLAGESDEVNKSTTIYKGTLRNVGLIGKTRVTLDQPSRREQFASMCVHKASTESSEMTESVLCPWPWIDHSKKSQELYQVLNGQFKSFDYQRLPTLSCPLQAHMLLRYLHTVKPCVSEKEFKKAHQMVEEFALNYGKQYHDIISDCYVHPEKNMENILPNYYYRCSTEEMPLKNIAIIAPFCHDVWPELENSSIKRSGVIIQLVIEFWHLLFTQQLKTICDDKGHCLNMEQFQNLFSSVSIPDYTCSQSYTFFKTESQSPASRHIVIIHRGHVFTMNVMDDNYKSLPEEDIQNSLREMLLYANRNETEPIGMLTCADRHTRTSTRECLIEVDGENENMLMEIEQAIFVLSIDHKKVRGLDNLANEALFGDGCNRWYEKSLNVYMHNNGMISLNINRTLIDGPIVAYLLHYIHLRLVEEITDWDDDDIMKSFSGTQNSFKSSTLNVNSHAKTNEEEIEQEFANLEALTLKRGSKEMFQSLTKTEARVLNFKLNDHLRNVIECSMHTFLNMSSALITATYKNDTIDSQLFARHTVNKDAFAHMVMHLTFYKMYFRMASSCSLISLKKFQGTRNDLLRSTTIEMAEWCRSMLNTHSSNSDGQQRREMFRRAEQTHCKLLHQCYNGESCNNYVNALRNLSEELELPPGNMFDNETFRQAGWTDQCDINSQSLGIGCTSCPVVLPAIPTGYGVGYSIANGFAFFTVTSWERQTSTNAHLYAASLRLCIDQVIDLICYLPVKEELDSVSTEK